MVAKKYVEKELEVQQKPGNTNGVSKPNHEGISAGFATQLTSKGATKKVLNLKK